MTTSPATDLPILDVAKRMSAVHDRLNDATAELNEAISDGRRRIDTHLSAYAALLNEFNAKLLEHFNIESFELIDEEAPLLETYGQPECELPVAVQKTADAAQFLLDVHFPSEESPLFQIDVDHPIAVASRTAYEGTYRSVDEFIDAVNTLRLQVDEYRALCKTAARNKVKQEFAALYERLVGYNPFDDDPELTVDDFPKMMSEYLSAMIENADESASA